MIPTIAELARADSSVAALKDELLFTGHEFGKGSWFQNAQPLTWIMEHLQPHTVLEVGSWMGASAYHFARHASVESVVCVDHWRKDRVENYREGVHPESWMDRMYDHFLANAMHTSTHHKICPLRGMSLEAAESLKRLGPTCKALGCVNGRVKLTDGLSEVDRDCDRCWGHGRGPFQADLVYIDGAHATDAVTADLEAYRPFVRPGGLYCGDDWNHSLPGEDVRGAVKAFASKHKATAYSMGNLWFLIGGVA